MSNKSNLDVAYDLIVRSEGPVEFKAIWAEIIEVQGLDPIAARKLIGQFYTNLSLDGRFVTLGENVWDLRERQEYEKVHIDMNDVYRDIETTQEIDAEEEEYNKIFEDEKDDEYDDDNEEKNNGSDDESDY